MDLTPYLTGLRDDLAKATALADDATRATADRLLVALEPALRLRLIQALADAAAQLSSELDGDLVDIRMDGADPAWNVQRRAAASEVEPTLVLPEVEDAGIARITLRLPDGVKTRADAAAEASGQSLNTWIVNAVRAQLTIPPAGRSGVRTGRHVTGWA